MVAETKLPSVAAEPLCVLGASVVNLKFLQPI